MTTVTREQALRFRWRAQQLDSPPGSRAAADVAILDAGAQDTGPDGALWALAARGADVRAHEWPQDVALAWTLRGAPHAYRRADLPDVEAALRPWSDADAAQRIFDASKPLRAAGIAPLAALAHAAATMRGVVAAPMGKGAVSTAMTALVDEPYLRWCRGCQATHMYEMPFRLAALHAGLELEPDTSPPVLVPVPGWPAGHVGHLEPVPVRPDLDLVRAALRFVGPATPSLVAGFLDARLADVRERWPADVVTVGLAGEERCVLAEDATALDAAAEPPHEPTVRLVGPYDLSLQARDRELLVPDVARHKALWPVLGRPGGVLLDGELVGTWRPRAKARWLALALDPWVPWDARLASAVAEEHARLAAFRGLEPDPKVP